MDTSKRTSPGAVVACKESTCFLRKSAFGHRWNLHLSRHARNLRHGIACASVRNCVLFAACNLHRMVMIFHACHDSGAKWKIAEGAENHLISLSCSCWSRIERTQNLHHCAMRCFKGQARTGIFEPWHGIFHRFPPISPCFHSICGCTGAGGTGGTGPTLWEVAPDRRCRLGASLLSLKLMAHSWLWSQMWVLSDVKHPRRGPQNEYIII